MKRRQIKRERSPSDRSKNGREEERDRSYESRFDFFFFFCENKRHKAGRGTSIFRHNYGFPLRNAMIFRKDFDELAL